MNWPIESINTRIVVMPLDEVIPHPFLGARTQFGTLLVEVHTVDGCTGLGWVTMENLHLLRAVESIVCGLAQSLKGMDAGARSALHERMWNLTVDLLHDGASNLAISAIDVALWDIAGHQAGVPLWKLLGGHRDKVPTYASWTLWRHHTDAQLESESARLVAQGHRAMKLRLGGGRTMTEDIERAKLVRNTVGRGIGIMVDGLWGLTPTQAIRLAHALAQLDYIWLEDPLRENDFRGLAQIHATHTVPVASGERISRLVDVEKLVSVVDHAILDVAHLGGITPWLKAAGLLDIHNLPISSHAYSLINLHLIAAVRTGAWVEDIPWWNVLFTEPPLPVDGFVQMGSRPGLGLALDESAVKRFTVR